MPADWLHQAARAAECTRATRDAFPRLPPSERTHPSPCAYMHDAGVERGARARRDGRAARDRRGRPQLGRARVAGAARLLSSRRSSTVDHSQKMGTAPTGRPCREPRQRLRTALVRAKSVSRRPLATGAAAAAADDDDDDDGNYDDDGDGGAAVAYLVLNTGACAARRASWPALVQAPGCPAAMVRDEW
eukprot:365365-Chlamydomonas_euryale.AAC.7